MTTVLDAAMFKNRLAQDKWFELNEAIDSANYTIGCRESDPEVFFPEEENPKGNKYTMAKKVCAVCPVRNLCLEFALVNYETYGMWGGLSPKERRRLKVAPRGRPQA